MNLLLKSNAKIDPISITLSCKKDIGAFARIALTCSSYSIGGWNWSKSYMCRQKSATFWRWDTKAEYSDSFKSLDKSFLFMFELVCSILSIFHGIAVESSLTIIDDILCKRSGRTKTETYSVFYSKNLSMDLKQENHLKEIVKYSLVTIRCIPYLTLSYLLT